MRRLPPLIPEAITLGHLEARLRSEGYMLLPGSVKADFQFMHMVPGHDVCVTVLIGPNTLGI